MNMKSCYVHLFFLLASSFASSFGASIIETVNLTGGALQAASQVDDTVNLYFKNADNASSSFVTIAPLEETYFHTDKSFTIWLHHVEIPSPAHIEFIKEKTVVLERRLALEIIMPELQIYGLYEVKHGPVPSDITNEEQIQSEIDESESASGVFKLILHNVTGAGQAFMELQKVGDDMSIGVSRAELDFIPQSFDVIISESTAEPEISNFIHDQAFANLVKEKLWRDLNHHMNLAVKTKLEQLMGKQNVKRMVKDTQSANQLEKYVLSSPRNVDGVVDEVLKTTREIIIKNMENKIKIPNISETFKVLVFSGKFTAHNGYAKDLATLHRSGTTNYATDENKLIHFYGNLGFRALKVHYDYYDVSILKLGPSGTLDATVSPVNIYLHLYVDFDGTNKLYLDTFRIEELGKLDVQVTGLGSLLNPLLSMIVTWVTGMYRDSVTSLVENKVREYLTQVLEENTLDDIVGGKAFGFTLNA